MSRLHVHAEHRLVDRIGWLRAAVLGANHGIISTASLTIAVAAAAATQSAVLIAGIAGLLPAPCQWPPASMCPSARSPTQSGRISRANA
jgi:vacuolar iron transporter family protein